MDFLNKLFGDAKKELSPLLEKLQQAAKEAGMTESSAKPAAKPEPKPEPVQAAPQPERMAYPPGQSWGEIMPEEENQFSYNGSYIKYFEEIFRAEFPQYRLQEEHPTGKRTVFTFWSGVRKALVVELLSQSSAVKALRRDCQQQGIPYLRYYYDHDGWWNTRTYVIDRTRRALGI